MTALTRKEWQSLKRTAPRVPGNTCPQIDAVLTKLETIVNREKPISEFQHKQLIKRMEQLRRANETLRESGHYWYDVAKDNLRP
jgi:hypothetical protein